MEPEEQNLEQMVDRFLRGESWPSSGAEGPGGLQHVAEVFGFAAAAPRSVATRLVIGPYHLLERIGAGGMGEVWLAEQREPVRRRVALKLIRAGMDSEYVLARFDSERQALALMDHPNIARIFDVGSTPEGRPYFVMEHVAGVPIREHCNRNRLPPRERLRLMLQVCAGVQHAHQKAVIHRDLKPSNVLVTSQDGRAVPKIIDFGLAKALSQPLTERTLHTELGVLVGTSAYTSPEQADRTAQDVDTRTDVYSLGVILYELLAGALPFEPRRLREAGYVGTVRILREEDPPRPSTRFSRLSAEASAASARERGADPATLKRQLIGDLDWITMKALEKDRSRRYGSVAELADDIRRHLEDLPVLSGPPTIGYRTKKFVRRHRPSVLAASLVVLALALGLVGTTTGLIRAREAETAARKEAATAGRVAGFLSDVLSSVDAYRMGMVLVDDLKQRAVNGFPSGAMTEAELAARTTILEGALAGIGGTDTARRVIDEEILGRAGTAIDTEMSDDPLIAATVHHTIGKTYFLLGMLPAAEQQVLRALDTRATLLGPEQPESLLSQDLLGVIRHFQGRYAEAEDLLRGALEARLRVLGPEQRDTLWSMAHLAFTLSAEAKYAEAEDLYRRLLATEERVLGKEDAQTLKTMNDFGFLYLTTHRVEEAERMHRETLQLRTRLLGAENRDTLWSLYNLAWAVEDMGKLDEAARLFEQCLDARRRTLGQDHPDTLWAGQRLAGVWLDQGHMAECERLNSEVLEARRRVLGAEHPDTAWSLQLRGLALYRLGQLEDSRRMFEQALAIRRKAFGDDHVETLSSANALRRVFWAGGWSEEARQMDRELLPAWGKAARRADASAIAKIGYASALLDGGQAPAQDAEEALAYALDAAKTPEDTNAAAPHVLALAYHTLGRATEAAEAQRQALVLVPETEVLLRARFESDLGLYEDAAKAMPGTGR